MTLFALLVGINDYPAPLTKLGGCVNDARDVLAYLQTIHADQLQPLSLIDQQATRAAVIAACRDHLGQAAQGDTALFYFAGHGSQQTTPPSLAHLEPDHQMETLVCWDSRTPTSWDLADKEIAVLIHEIAARGAQVVVIFDCCHSGTATRGYSHQRQLPSDERERPPESLLGVSITRGASSWDIQPGRHVLLAACKEYQLAAEQSINGVAHGLFTAALLRALRVSATPPTYRDLMTAVTHRIAASQLPTLEATHADDLDRIFLGSQRIESHRFFVAHHEAEWLLDGGSIHGLRADQAVSLYPFDAPLSAAAPLPTPLTTATIHAVEPHQAHLSVANSLSPGDLYKAVPADDGMMDSLLNTVRCAPPGLLEIALYQYTTDDPNTAKQIASSDGTRSPFTAQVDYHQQAGMWYFPRFEVRITHWENHPLYLALLHLSEDGSIRSLIPGGLGRLESGETQTVRAGAVVPDEIWQRGQSDAREHLKLIAHGAPFNTVVLEQNGARRGGGDLPYVMLDINITVLRPSKARIVR